MNNKVVVAMSGGVDSSVAAYLLKEQGYDVTGLFMSLGTCLEKMAPKRKACCSIFDAQDARKVADKLDIKFSILDFKKDFEELIRYFVEEYDRGRTPNPCIRCNQLLKFGKLMEYADKLGAEYIATGHYARIECSPSPILSPQGRGKGEGRYILRKGVDASKDQSYVLFALTQAQLSRVMFPIGGLTKAEVRKLAHKIDLPVKDKPESQDVCFVPTSGYETLLRQRIPERIRPGDIVDTAGKVVGRHKGYQLYTIGQRRGLKVALGKPAYVTKIDFKTNTVTLGDKADVLSDKFAASNVNWVSIADPGRDKLLEADVKIRYLHKQAKARIKVITPSQAEIKFKEPQPAITPGQAAVFYKDDIVLGGGWIE
ncbi:MAG: tRNA 2-thiouridine(34) synthase MnmA [Planctomycetota bacterium]